MYTNIAGPAQRRIDELALQGVAPQAIIDDIDTQFDLQFSRIEMQKLAMDLKLAQQAKNDPFLTNRLVAIKSQEEAIANINTVRGQNMLSDLYADAQGDFLRTELGSQRIINVKPGGEAERAVKRRCVGAHCLTLQKNLQRHTPTHSNQSHEYKTLK